MTSRLSAPGLLRRQTSIQELSDFDNSAISLNRTLSYDSDDGGKNSRQSWLNMHYCLVSLMWMKIGSNDITAQVPGVS
jgi:hypothetical protein